MLFVEHDMEVVSRFAQRVLAFYDGRIIAEVRPPRCSATRRFSRYVVGGDCRSAWTRKQATPMLRISGLDVVDRVGADSARRRTGAAERQMAGLIGRNGAGKTTLMHGIMGLLPARGGTIDFDGDVLTRIAPHARTRLGIGYMPEDRRLVPELTVEENVLVPAWALGLPNAEARWKKICALIPEIEALRRAQGVAALGWAAEAGRDRARADVRHQASAARRAIRGRRAGARARGWSRWSRASSAKACRSSCPSPTCSTRRACWTACSGSSAAR